MTEFEFVDDISEHTHFGASPNPLFVRFAAALKDNPKRWAKYPVDIRTKANTASLINRGKGPVAFRGGGFEARAVDGNLYVRYVGGES